MYSFQKNGLELNVVKTKYMVILRVENEKQSQIKYFGNSTSERLKNSNNL